MIKLWPYQQEWIFKIPFSKNHINTFSHYFMYWKTICKISVNFDKSFTPPIEQSFFKGIWQKIQRKYWNFSFLHFMEKIISVQGCEIAKPNLSNQDGSFDTHIDIDFDKPLLVANVIKCHKMPFYVNFTTYAIWHKMSQSMSIWVSKEAYWSDKVI